MAGTIVSDTIQNGTGTSTSTTNVIQGCAKAWVNYNGVTQTINNSFNVSSVTYSSTGIYIVNMTTAMPNAFYVTQLTGNNSGSRLNTYGYINTQTTTAMTCTFCDDQSTKIDVSNGSIAIFA